tara:strand:- start:2664 stop:3047 length:384 start_codon:yes stop_codon:yes gene_type:complete
MAYSDIKVIAGGLAHIPIIIGFFYFIQNKIFAKKTEIPNSSDKKEKDSGNAAKKNIAAKSPSVNKEIPNPSKNPNESSDKIKEAKKTELTNESSDKAENSSNPIKNTETPSKESPAEGSPSSDKLEQ